MPLPIWLDTDDIHEDTKARLLIWSYQDCKSVDDLLLEAIDYYEFNRVNMVEDPLK